MFFPFFPKSSHLMKHFLLSEVIFNCHAAARASPGSSDTRKSIFLSLCILQSFCMLCLGEANIKPVKYLMFWTFTVAHNLCEALLSCPRHDVADQFPNLGEQCNEGLSCNHSSVMHHDCTSSLTFGKFTETFITMHYYIWYASLNSLWRQPSGTEIELLKLLDCFECNSTEIAWTWLVSYCSRDLAN